MKDDQIDFDDYSEEYPAWMADSCPNCGREYDEIDYEYQICIYCGYENKKPQ